MSHPSRAVSVDPAEVRIAPGTLPSRLPWVGLGFAVVGLAGWALAPEAVSGQRAFSWLTAYVFWLSISLGALFFVISLFASDGRWGVAVRRLAETLAATLPLFVVFFAPLWIFRETLFHWAEPGAAAHDPLLAHKASYLNAEGMLVRAAVYFLAWSALAVWYLFQSRAQDRDGDFRYTRRMRNLSGPAIVIFGLTVTFAALDWLMSLEPHWFSTIFGVYYFSGCLVGIFAFLILSLITLRRSGLLRSVVGIEHFHDLGKLLFAFTIFWSYIAFSQYFLIWYGNIPEESFWYLERLTGSWREASGLLALGHFVVPFFYLMPRTIKRKTPFLAAGAVWMLLMHYLDLYWLVMPTLHREGVAFSVHDIAALMGIGGLTLAAWGWVLQQQALVPVRDPYLSESVAFENV